jgi:UDP-glucuronate 4-epimerase
LEIERVLVTGSAGFIGFHFTKRLLDEGYHVRGLDNFNAYYSVRLKEARAAELAKYPGFCLDRLDLADRQGMAEVFEEFKPEVVVNLAAQAGVRYSLDNPAAYVDSNLVGFGNILEGCRHGGVKHLVYASSSSVYGANVKTPFEVSDSVDHPVSLYAATKKANELMAHTYSHLFGLPTTGLRFFTVYGPWGRPDMAIYKFTDAIVADKPIDVYNFGNMKRDFTYVDDIVEGVFRTMKHVPQANPDWDRQHPDPASSYAPYKVYNIGNNTPTDLLEFIAVLEKALGKKAEKNLLPMQPGDVLETFADVADLTADVGFRPSTPIEVGVPKFIEWYKSYHGV